MKKLTKSLDKQVLKVEARTLLGKKIKKLRKQGIVPANIFGPEFKSISISVDKKEFIKIYRVARETGVVYLSLGKEEIPCLIKHLQKHPVTDVLLHIDFRKIDLAKKIETDVPVKTIGISEAVTQKGGVLLLQSDNLLVEALPQDIPHTIDVDISAIKELGQEIKVGDIAKSEKYQIKTSPEKVVVSVVAHKEESITPDTATAAPEVLTEAAPEEGEEGAAVTPEAGKGPTPAVGKAPAAGNVPATKPAKPEAVPAKK